jgi:hypothetical protein
LTVIGFSHWSENKSKSRKRCQRSVWLCKCDCGSEIKVRGDHLTRANTESCGCLQKEIAARIASSKKLPNGEGALNNVLCKYKSEAKNRGLGWELSDEQFKALTQLNCTSCGAEPSTVYRTKTSECTYNGLDRIDNTKGYSSSNVQTMCKNCNFAKRDMSRGQFDSWINRLIIFRTNL